MSPDNKSGRESILEEAAYYLDSILFLYGKKLKKNK